MSDKQVNQSRRVVLGGTVLGMGAVSTWSTPAIKAIVTPTHAMMSPVCPDIVVDDVLISAPSGDTGVCFITFDIFSSDPEVPIEILSVETTALEDNVSVDVRDDLPFEVTMSEGTRIVWEGPAADAPFCNADSQPIDDITFTITAQCEEIPDMPYSLTVTLLELYELAELGNPV